MSWTVRVDKQSCQSSGNCVEAAPEAFGWDGDDLGDALPGAAALAPARLIEVAKRCPALCISVCDEHGNEVDLDA